MTKSFDEVNTVVLTPYRPVCENLMAHALYAYSALSGRSGHRPSGWLSRISELRHLLTDIRLRPDVQWTSPSAIFDALSWS